MSERLGVALLELSTDQSKLNAGIDAARGQAEKLAADFEKLGKAATLGISLPLVALGATAVSSFNEQAKAVALMENAIRSTGGVAGKTSSQLQGMSEALQKNSLFGDEQILGKVITQLLTFTNISGSSFDRATKAALDMSSVLGQDLQSSAIQLGKALNDPINGVTALQRVGVRLTDQQKDMVQAFMDSGDIMSAQNIILKELETEFGGAAEAAAKAGTGPFTQLANKIDDLGEKFGELIVDALVPLLGMVNDLVDEVASWDASTQKMILAIGALAAAAGPALYIIGAIGTSLAAGGTLATGITLVTSGVTALGAAFAALGPGGIAVAMAALVAVTYKIADATGLIDALARKIGDWTGASKVVTDANKDLETATNRAAMQLKDKYGVEIVRGTKSLNDWNKEVVDALRQHASLATATEKTTTATQKHVPTLKEQEEALKKAKEAVQEADKAHMAFLRTLNAVPVGAFSSDLDRIKAKIDDFHNGTTLAYDKWAAFRNLLTTPPTSTVEDAFAGIDFKAAAATANVAQLAVAIDGVLAKPPAVAVRFGPTEAEVARQRTHLEQAASEFTDSMKRSAGAVFDAMFQKGENVFTSLQNALKGGVLSLGRAIFEDVTSALLGPIKRAFDSFFNSLLEGLGFKAFLSGLGSKIGTALGGIWGVGGTAAAATGTATAAAGATGGAAAAGAGGLGGAVGAFMTNPWTIAIGAAIAGAIALTKSQAHHEANTFVRELQNPFGEAIGKISDAFASAERTGNLTVEAAEEAEDQVRELWSTFQRQAREFAAKGKDEAKVVQQAFAQLEPFMGRIFADMDKSIATLQNNIKPLMSADAWGIPGLSSALSGLKKYISDIDETIGKVIKNTLIPIEPEPAALPPQFNNGLPAGAAVSRTPGATKIENAFGLKMVQSPFGNWVLVPRDGPDDPAPAVRPATQYRSDGTTSQGSNPSTGAVPLPQTSFYRTAQRIDQGQGLTIIVNGLVGNADDIARKLAAVLPQVIRDNGMGGFWQPSSLMR